MSIKAYQTNQTRADTPAQVEYRLLAEVTRRLLSIEDVKAPKATETVYENITVWSTFASDLMMPENPLPDPLKAQLISLFLWVQRHSRQVLRGEASVAPLVDVNKAIMAGLAEQGAAKGAAGAAEGSTRTVDAA